MVVIRPRPCFLDDQIYLRVYGGRKVWRSPDGKRLYTWDSLHGEIEVFNSRGRHLGSADPMTGKLIKPAVEGRSIDV